MAEVTSHRIEVRGLSMHVRGPAGCTACERTPVVLVHGMVVSSRYMERLLEALVPEWPTFAPDLPGFGRSDDPGRLLELPELADFLAWWMDAAAIERASFIGNSFGCQIAAELAVRHPDRVERLVLQGPTAEPSSRTSGAQLGRFARNATRDSPGMMPIMLRDYLDAGIRRTLHTFRMTCADHIEDKLPSIGAPTLVVSGERDPIAPPEWGRKLASLLPQGSHTVLAGSAHTAVFSATRSLLRAVRPFLKGQAVPPVIPEPEERPPQAVASFDSASAFLRATGRVLHGESFPGLGIDSPVEPFVPLANALPVPLRKWLYSMGGWAEGVSAEELARLDLDEIDRWIVGQYPERRFPAIFVGASNGAAVHLCSLVGAPMLPQTLLLPLRDYRGSVDDVRGALERTREVGRALVAAQPDLSLHHMHDPNQDRLMARHMAYFRVKRRRLRPTWERFIRERLEPGGTIFVTECEQSWPCTRVDERYWFQVGGVGGLGPEEYLQRWDAPEPDERVPEAEWGFDPALLEDLERLAAREGFRVRRIRFSAPDDLSPVVADLYRSFYRTTGRPTDHLVVETFVMIEPWWVLRTGTVPYWCHFAVESAADKLEAYLRHADPFDRVDVMLFSHGARSEGLAPVDRWRSLMARAEDPGRFIGVDDGAFPRDFGVLKRYHEDFPRKVRVRYPLPPPLSVHRLEALLGEGSGKELALSSAL